MNIPDDLQGMYNNCLDIVSKDIDKISISPEMILALIERISQLETDIANPNSYMHYNCRQRLSTLLQSSKKEN